MHRVALILVLAACSNPTDYGQPCVLKTKSGPLHNRDLSAAAGKDFISFGSTECEDLVCVRDVDAPIPADPNAVAVGYCSNRCQQGSACTPADPADDLDPKKKLRCRALVLDEETLRSIDLGGLKSPYFCARGGVTDGGTPGN